MSDEQLIKWLRDDSEEHRKFFPSDRAYFKMHQQAADRIDQITTECDALAERVRELEEGLRALLDECELIDEQGPHESMGPRLVKTRALLNKEQP